MRPDFVYTDGQAVREGVLFPVFGNRYPFQGAVVDRLSASVVDKLLPGMRDSWVRDNPIDTVLVHARDTAKPGELQGWLFEATVYEVTFWLQRNERNNWTLLLPSDY